MKGKQSDGVPCQGNLKDMQKKCGGVRRPQPAGRYLTSSLIPYLCLNQRCSEYGIPYNEEGERQQWVSFEEMVQLQGDF